MPYSYRNWEPFENVYASLEYPLISFNFHLLRCLVNALMILVLHKFAILPLPKQGKCFIAQSPIRVPFYGQIMSKLRNVRELVIIGMANRDNRPKALQKRTQITRQISDKPADTTKNTLKTAINPFKSIPSRNNAIQFAEQYRIQVETSSSVSSEINFRQPIREN